MTETPATEIHGVSTTGMVHVAREIEVTFSGRRVKVLTQACGAPSSHRGQRQRLGRTDAPVTCKKCLAH